MRKRQNSCGGNMDWFAQIDGYCERIDATFWSEPLNTVTNAAFVIAALIMWQRSRTTGGKMLCVILAMIGLGSFAFHTFATRWAGLADVVPIGAYILTYLYLVNRNIAGLSLGWAAAATACYLPFAALIVPAVNQLPFFHISGFYWTVPLLLVGYGIGLRLRGFLIGAGILAVSITVRSLDEIWCAGFPIGTHFVWHLLNGFMLGYMIAVYETRALARQGAQG